MPGLPPKQKRKTFYERHEFFAQIKNYYFQLALFMTGLFALILYTIALRCVLLLCLRLLIAFSLAIGFKRKVGI